MPERIQRKRTKGSRLPAGAICVTRGTRWGNPFRVVDGDRATAVRLYEDWLPTSGLDVSELRGKNLACFCPLSEPCHADVLLRLANK